MNTSSFGGDSTPPITTRAAEKADAAMQVVREKTHDAIDGLTESMQTVKDQAAATMERFRPQIDAVANYAKDEPTKALLIAAATGAALMALVSLMGRSSSEVEVPSSKRLRRTANDTADQWRKAVSSASNEATSRADDVMNSARGAARSVYDGIADTVQQLRDQAAPMVDRVRPQIDAVTGYAKDDPAKALLIAAAAGAALMGLMSARKH